MKSLCFVILKRNFSDFAICSSSHGSTNFRRNSAKTDKKQQLWNQETVQREQDSVVLVFTAATLSFNTSASRFWGLFRPLQDRSQLDEGDQTQECVVP
ncbi:hypothetical protein ACROYT_G005210 [Oculina patagonica]